MPNENKIASDLAAALRALKKVVDVFLFKLPEFVGKKLVDKISSLKERQNQKKEGKSAKKGMSDNQEGPPEQKEKDVMKGPRL